MLHHNITDVFSFPFPIPIPFAPGCLLLSLTGEVAHAMHNGANDA
jgi:hypothetical protein